MANMKRRERVLLVVTVLVVLPLLAYHFFLADWLEGMAAQGGGDFAAERARFHAYRETLEEREAIETAYSRIDFAQTEPLPGQNATEHFSNELARLLTEDFGITNPPPRITPARPQAIASVPEYYFVELRAVVSGTPEDMLRLLVDMEHRGVLVKSFTLAQSGGFNREQEQVELTVDVARLVKHTEESRNQMRRWGVR